MQLNETIDDDFSVGAPAPGEGVLIGKRYSGGTMGLDVLCTKPGGWPLERDGRPLTVPDPKPLPSAD